MCRPKPAPDRAIPSGPVEVRRHRFSWFIVPDCHDCQYTKLQGLEYKSRSRMRRLVPRVYHESEFPVQMRQTGWEVIRIDEEDLLSSTRRWQKRILPPTWQITAAFSGHGRVARVSWSRYAAVAILGLYTSQVWLLTTFVYRESRYDGERLSKEMLADTAEHSGRGVKR